jgi:hypothetical protein
MALLLLKPRLQQLVTLRDGLKWLKLFLSPWILRLLLFPFFFVFRFSPVSGKTVRVRFVLEKQCAVDQSVYLVGDDPALGLWDPANAIPLECAESHEWILEKVSLGLCPLFGVLLSS